MILVSSSTTVRRMRYLMGCLMTIDVEGDEEGDVEMAVEEAFAEMKRVESRLSKFNSNSDISKINQLASRAPVGLDPEIYEIISRAIYYGELSEGALDITVNPLFDLWNQAEKQNKLPSPEDIMNVLKHVGQDKVILDDKTKSIYFARSGMTIDLGAMGKGYAIDQAMHVLRKRGIKNATIDAGSTICYFGEQEATFGIANPQNTYQVSTTVSLNNNSISTSADYERFWTIKNKKYGHILDPAVGYPVVTDLLSASVVSSSAMMADLFSTLLFSKGELVARQLLEKNEVSQVILITQLGQIIKK